MDFKRLLILFFTLAHITQTSFGQFSMEEFLGSARNDLSLDPTQNKIDFLQEDFNNEMDRLKDEELNRLWEDNKKLKAILSKLTKGENDDL